MANENSTAAALSIILRAFQLIFDNELSFDNKEPIMAKLSPEEIASVFKLTAKSEKPKTLKFIREVKRSAVPLYNVTKHMAYKRAERAAYAYARFYKDCFE